MPPSPTQFADASPPPPPLSTNDRAAFEPFNTATAGAAPVAFDSVRPAVEGAVAAVEEQEKSGGAEKEGQQESDDEEKRGSTVLEMEKSKSVEGLSEEQRRRLEEQG